MTNSTIARERLEWLSQISGRDDIEDVDGGEIRELARAQLAAMDSEGEYLPLDYLQGHKDGLEWAAQLAKANHPETGDWLYDDPIELAKAIRKGPEMPPAQSVDSEPVAWDYEWASCITCDGPQDFKCVIEREAPPEWAIEEGQARNVIPLYRHAQQPVASEECPAEIRDLMASHSDALFNDDDAQEIWNACRAAMLNHPSSIQPNTDASPGTEIKHPSSNSPVIPEGYVMVPKEPTECMVIAGFEAELREEFLDPDGWEAYEAMSGCERAALRAKWCWAAMVKAAQKKDFKP
ncbi:DUF551 domain-containing protein [Klebsiella michiganensis]|uniref:DUF551 domain-containing protein n=1 Tax=Klebsiella michiganensis TaxID=1134687 RepID=UPI001F1D12E2